MEAGAALEDTLTEAVVEVDVGALLELSAPGTFRFTLKPAGRACCRAEAAPKGFWPEPVGLVDPRVDGSKASMKAELSLASDARFAAGGPPAPAPRVFTPGGGTVRTGIFNGVDALVAGFSSVAFTGTRPVQ